MKAGIFALFLIIGGNYSVFHCKEWFWLECTFHFHQRMKTAPSWLSWNTDVSPEQSKADQHGVEQRRPTRSRAKLSSGRGAWPQSCSTVLLFSQPYGNTTELLVLNWSMVESGSELRKLGSRTCVLQHLFYVPSCRVPGCAGRVTIGRWRKCRNQRWLWFFGLSVLVDSGVIYQDWKH